MELKILRETQNPLLLRKEVQIEISTEGKSTPKNEEVKKQLASHFKTEEKLVSIKTIKQIFGLERVVVTAKIYKDEASYNKFEKINKKIKQKPAAEQPAPAK